MFSSLWGAPAAAPADAGYTQADALWYLNPTAEQQSSLSAFRKQLELELLLVPDHDDDCTLLRFLMARDFKQDKAVSMYRDMRAWRTENGVDGLYAADPGGEAFPEMERLLQVYPHFTLNTDKFGRPVYVELLGRTDVAALFETISMERLIRYHIWTWERYLRYYLPGCSAAAGRHICTTTVIIDLAGLSLKTFNSSTQKLLNTFSKIDQDYYPEHLGTMFIINTPLIFRGIWAAIQPLLQERTRKKIIMLGADYLPELTKIVPLERLPHILGGTTQLDSAYSSVGPWLDAVAGNGEQREQAAALGKQEEQQQPQSPKEAEKEQQLEAQQQQQQEPAVGHSRSGQQVDSEACVVSVSAAGGDASVGGRRAALCKAAGVEAEEEEAEGGVNAAATAAEAACVAAVSSLAVHG